MEKRGFRELNISPCSYQSPTDRYPPKGGVKAPHLVLNRNNLTALSQCRNLLFIACIDKLYIYKPQLPTQIIASKPELILDVPKSRRGLRGHIDPSKPHAINQLVIGDLGDEEIVVAVCDDGDIAVHTTRSIYNVIEHDNLRNGDSSKPPVKIKTLLLRNVGLSAWGIAIHKAARLIAVSSNLHQISVFAFALSQHSSPDTRNDIDDDKFLATHSLGPDNNLWERIDESSYSPLQRSSKNVELILRGHQANIPNIAFYNTKSDLIGQYLVSTDITGSVFVWNVWERKIIANLTSPKRAARPLCGWGVTCLDPHSYRSAYTVRETFGCDCASSRGELDNAARIPCFTYDNTANSQSVANSSQWHPCFSKYRVVPNESSYQPGLETSDLSEEIANSDNEEMGENNDDLDIDMDEDEAEVEETQSETSSSASNFSSGYPGLAGNSSQILSSLAQPMPSLKDSVNTASAPIQNTGSKRRRDSSALPFDIFTTSEFDLRFLFHIQLEDDNKRPIAYDSVICKEALHQEIPPMLRYMNHYERLNMVIQIPELSVIIVANQLGRVALLTMTKSAIFQNNHGFRIDWILPFRTQEDQNLRSELPLIGIAAGPVQCREMMPGGPPGARDDSPEPFCADALHRYPGSTSTKRYRLFLFYYDNSILSYEFWRPPFEHRHKGVWEPNELMI